MATYIHQSEQWSHFTWDKELVADKLATINKASGFLMGRLRFRHALLQHVASNQRGNEVVL